MEKITVLKMDEEDLTILLRKVIREEIQFLFDELKKEDKDDILLDRDEVYALLKISKAMKASQK